MPDTLYLPYLVALFLLPLLVKWRWGLTAVLLVGVVELALVGLTFYLMSIYPCLATYMRASLCPSTRSQG